MNKWHLSHNILHLSYPSYLKKKSNIYIYTKILYNINFLIYILPNSYIFVGKIGDSL